MARKIRARTQNSGWSDPSKKKKIRKPRKPMTDEQRQAAAERLKKAREARAKKNPNYGKSGLHSSLHNLDEDYALHPDKVKEWIKVQKELVSTEKRNERSNERSEYNVCWLDVSICRYSRLYVISIWLQGFLVGFSRYVYTCTSRYSFRLVSVTEGC